MEKIPKGSPEYFLIEKEYKSLVTNITREKDFKPFIGGLPVTLERKDIFTILSKDLSGNYRYSATQKVDGTRLLLFANFEKDTGLRNITFIDRNNDFYSLKNRNREPLPDFKGPKVLIDGELVTFNNDNQVTNPTDKYYNIKMFSFMAFDILYGPISIDYSGPPQDKRLNIGSEGSLAGPIGGKMWPYQKRYDILYQLIVPNELNDFRPILSLAFKNTGWFVPEIKPIFFINALRTTKKLYESGNSKAFFQENLIKFRETFYKLINEKIRTKQNEHAELLNVSLDGLVFTPFDTEYIVGGAWKKFLNIQYKWKPEEEQSVDFAIFKEGQRYVLKIRKGKNLTTFTIRKNQSYVPVEVTKEASTELSRSKTRDGTIGEFVYNTSKQQFELLRIRRDKDSPNSLSTAINVMNAIKNPVDLEIIKKFFIINKLNEQGLKQLLRYMTKSQMLRCMVNNNKLDIFNSDIKKQLSEEIKKFKTNNAYEFEIRFGIIEPQKFQANIPFNLYKQIIDIISLLYKNIKVEYSVFYDLYSRNIRTRYLYLEDLRSTIKLASIEKLTIENVNIDLKYLYNLDLRFALSNEKQTTEIVTKQNADLVLEKKRHSFNFGNIFTLDITEIIKINKVDGKETREAPKYQVELEVKNRSLSEEELIDKITNQLVIIMGLINS
uniref:Uncharacterized protein n=1 Tax=viral metagenome TaxID=1070528 RepID=A0A6C0LG22_9ZZZZ